MLAQLTTPSDEWVMTKKRVMLHQELSSLNFIAILNAATSLGSATGLVCCIDVGHLASQVLGLGDKNRRMSLLP